MSSATGQKLNFLTIGLPAHHPSVPDHIRPKVAEMLEKANEQFKHCNAPIEHIAVTPDDYTQFVQRLTADQPAAVVIGNGIRSNLELTHFMEQLIDAMHTHAPQCRVLFNTTPMTVVDAIQRWYPEVKMNS